MSFHHSEVYSSYASYREPSDVDYYEARIYEDSVASFESNFQEHAIEQVLAETSRELSYRPGVFHRWVLIKWTNSPVLESSWEHSSILDDYPKIRERWEVEQKRQIEGKSVPFDVEEFNIRLREQEIVGRQRRKLRRFRKHIRHIVDILQAD